VLLDIPLPGVIWVTSSSIISETQSTIGILATPSLSIIIFSADRCALLISLSYLGVIEH